MLQDSINYKIHQMTLDQIREGTEILGPPRDTPRFGAFDAAFDAFYVYEYFHDAGGFAAVPWGDRPSHRKQFSNDGLPLCAVGLPMPIHSSLYKAHSLSEAAPTHSLRLPSQVPTHRRPSLPRESQKLGQKGLRHHPAR